MATDRQKRLAVWLGGATVVASAVTFTSHQEGTVTHVYQDPARADLLTACTGETHYIVTPGDIKPGATFTREQCAQALYRSMAEHAEPVMQCTEGANLTTGQKIAFLDIAYNGGGAMFCKSSMARKAKAGDVQGSCDAILLYRFAGGKDCSLPSNKHVCGGIWDRRQKERAICLGG
jgi:lysozyme